MKASSSLLIFVLSTGYALALEPTSDPYFAVVRIKSHGASGTIISTAPGRSWILSCCHMFYGAGDRIDQSLIRKKIVIDGPPQPYATKHPSQVRVVATDANHDLSLLEIDNGPFNYVPVAPAGFKPGRNVASAGYDSMKWPITRHHATILIELGDWTYTREKPLPGRSGGGLVDLDARVLIGVVNGYELSGQRRGIYVSHEAVIKFMNRNRERMTPKPATPPAPGRQYQYSQPCPT
jgi:hypothetical protein